MVGTHEPYLQLNHDDPDINTNPNFHVRTDSEDNESDISSFHEDPSLHPDALASSTENGDSSGDTAGGAGWKADQSVETPSSCNWPDKPMMLNSRNATFWTTLLVDLALIIIALLFLALAIGAICLNGTPTGTTTGKTAEQASRIGPSIFPIMFAALVGRALRDIARYRVEQDISIESMYLLLNSRTMFETGSVLWILRSRFLSKLAFPMIALLSFWTLSPIGGQASLRVLFREQRGSIANSTVRYVDFGPLGNYYTGYIMGLAQSQSLDRQSLPRSLSDTFSASLMQTLAQKISPVDAWGNVKIPRLERQKYDILGDHGWVPVANVSDVESYSSLLGLPIVDLPDTHNGSVGFEIGTAYVSLSCKPPYQTPDEGGPLEGDNAGFNVTCPDCDKTNGNGSNSTFRAARKKAFWGPPATETANSLNATQRNPRTIRFSRSGSNGWAMDCAIKQTLVDVLIECARNDCHATGVRPSQTDKRSENCTSFDDWADPSVLDSVTAATYRTSYYWSSSLELFLNDSSRLPVIFGYGATSSPVNISTLPQKVFEDRMGILLNTYLQIFMAPTAFAGNLPKANMSRYGPEHILSDGLKSAGNASYYKSIYPISSEVPPAVVEMSQVGAPFMAAATAATITNFKEVYRPVAAWVAILISTSLGLLCLELVGLCSRFRVRGPNMFDPIIGLTVDNPNMQTGRYGSTLDATERVQRLGSQHIRLGDLVTEEGNRVALAPTHVVAKLDIRKKYL